MGTKKDLKTAKAKTKALKKTVSSLDGELASAEKKAKKAKVKAQRWKREAAAQRTIAETTQEMLERRAAEEASLEANEPNEEWTVKELRAEAKERGLVGMSNKTKAELLAVLA